jgi:hypothetical protein
MSTTKPKSRNASATKLGRGATKTKHREKNLPKREKLTAKKRELLWDLMYTIAQEMMIEGAINPHSKTAAISINRQKDGFNFGGEDFGGEVRIRAMKREDGTFENVAQVIGGDAEVVLTVGINDGSLNLHTDQRIFVNPSGNKGIVSGSRKLSIGDSLESYSPKALSGILAHAVGLVTSYDLKKALEEKGPLDI